MGMTQELTGKVAIVTGGAAGIGRGTVERFLAEGARVVIADVDEDAGNALAADLGSDTAFKTTDVADPAQVGALVDFAVETFGGVQIMFNNAGIGGTRHLHLLDDDLADFHRVMDINLLGVMVGTRDVARHMAANGGGSVINITSIGGMQAGRGPWTYHASKAAVIMFSQSAAIDLGEHGIRVNCIAPGNIETTILGRQIAPDASEEEREEVMRGVRAFLIDRQPIKRQGAPSDIAEAAVYFASDRSSFVTGTVLPVDGGLVAGPAGGAAGGILDDIKKRAKAST
jgi:NAD(P)-dependent dehydrogenase (short-subunit alcohol dehydrogenase family)